MLSDEAELSLVSAHVVSLVARRSSFIVQRGLDYGLRLPTVPAARKDSTSLVEAVARCQLRRKCTVRTLRNSLYRVLGCWMLDVA